MDSHAAASLVAIIWPVAAVTFLMGWFICGALHRFNNKEALPNQQELLDGYAELCERLLRERSIANRKVQELRDAVQGHVSLGLGYAENERALNKLLTSTEDELARVQNDLSALEAAVANLCGHFWSLGKFENITEQQANQLWENLRQAAGFQS